MWFTAALSSVDFVDNFSGYRGGGLNASTSATAVAETFLPLLQR